LTSAQPSDTYTLSLHTLFRSSLRAQSQAVPAASVAEREFNALRICALSSTCMTIESWQPSPSLAFCTALTRTRPCRAALQISCRSEEHTSELQSRGHLVCRLL